MKIGICGYGNLGRAVEKNILSNKQDKLVAIFSRREKVFSDCNTKIYPYSMAEQFKDKIDVMIMCGGSQEDLLWQSPEMLKNFNIIDTFDTHAKINEHKLALLKQQAKSNKTAIYSCGWDPGLFSIVRTLFASVFLSEPQTFWGKGVSQGHSEALRNIKGIKDAVQFTVPNKEILNKVKQNPTYHTSENERHVRVCYIALDETRPAQDIIDEIVSTPNYFKGQKVIVNVCSAKKVAQLKRKMYHQGVVVGGDQFITTNFNVKMASNPDFTAKILLCFAHAIPALTPGVYSVLDIPISKLKGSTNYL